EIARPQMQERRLGPMPPLILTLPRTGRYYLSIFSVGIYSIYYTFRLRTFQADPQSLARDQRDVILVSSRAGGATRSNRARVNADPAGFDNVMPEVAVDGLGQVHIVWYDRRDYPGCEPLWHTYWTESQDGGQSFLPSRRLSSQPSRWMPIPTFGFYNIGDHLAVEAQGDGAYALWTQIGSPDFDIYGAGIRSDAVGIAIPWFRAEALSDGVHLTWMVSNASDIGGFRIHRAESGSETYATLSADLLPVEGEGEQGVMDRTVEPGRAYVYRLEVVLSGGQARWYGPVQIAVPQILASLAWVSGQPHPSSEAVQLELAVPHEGRLSVRIYNIAGRAVALLFEGRGAPGRLPLLWDGRDSAGARVLPGVYLVRAELGREVSTKRILRTH